MATDGVASSELQLVLSGLSPGKHTIVTYHNALDDKPSSAYKISLNGEPILKNLQPAKRATSNEDAAAAFMEVNVEPGKDVTVGIKPTGAGNVILNGFAIDIPDPARSPHKPAPANYDEHAEEKELFEPRPGSGVVSDGGRVDEFDLHGVLLHWR